MNKFHWKKSSREEWKKNEWKKERKNLFERIFHVAQATITWYGRMQIVTDDFVTWSRLTLFANNNHFQKKGIIQKQNSKKPFRLLL